jgi:peptidoglycan/xylan/chitin deacetylase (PgdA/CDA1 family)
MNFLICGFVLIAIALFLQIQYNLFAPPVKGLPILMYHKVSVNQVSGVSVTVHQLEQQFQYIADHHYTCIRLSDLIDPNFKYPEKPLLITFDDGYRDNLELLYPLLKKYHLNAAIMLPVKFIGQTSEWEEEPSPLLDYGHLREMDPQYIGFGLHSFSHTNFKTISPAEVANDISECFRRLSEQNIPFVPVLAYPYGGYPRKQPGKEIFFRTLKENGIPIGFRIGNKINKLPIKRPYEVKRIDIKGTESFRIFRTKLKKGRVKMF